MTTRGQLSSVEAVAPAAVESGPLHSEVELPRQAAARRRRAPAIAATGGVDVVLVTRDSEADLARSLESIREAATDGAAGLLFVDLGSSDGTRTFAAAHAPGARAVWLNREDGLMEALLVAATASDAEVLVVINPSLEPAGPEAISRLVTHLNEHPYAAIAAPAIRGHSGEMLPSVRPAPGPRDFARVEWVLGDAFAIRRADLEALAACNGGMVRSLEQIQICLQLRRRGRELHYIRGIELLDRGGRVADRLRGAPRAPAVTAWQVLLRHPRYALRLAGRRRPGRRAAHVLRRALDVAIAGLLLLILSPLLLAILIAVRIDSPGPVVFRQTRLGRKARPFRMYKFRTMRSDADPELHARFVREMIAGRLRGDAGSGAGRVFKVYPDPRVTRVGRLLRRTSLDELPQLFNVLRGEMTLVGFRPPIPYEVDEYPAWYHRRFDGRPGITGLWQVSGRNERSYEEMVRLDIEYLNRRSWLFDALLLIRTVAAVVGGRGAY